MAETSSNDRAASACGADDHGEEKVHAVTGAFGYSGRYITKRLLAAGYRVRTLTGSPQRQHDFGDQIDVRQESPAIFTTLGPHAGQLFSTAHFGQSVQLVPVTRIRAHCKPAHSREASSGSIITENEPSLKFLSATEFLTAFASRAVSSTFQFAPMSMSKMACRGFFVADQGMLLKESQS